MSPWQILVRLTVLFVLHPSLAMSGDSTLLTPMDDHGKYFVWVCIYIILSNIIIRAHVGPIVSSRKLHDCDTGRIPYLYTARGDMLEIII